jgi:hypothetical protein
MEVLRRVGTEAEFLDGVDDNLPHFHVDGGRVVRAEGGGVAIVPLEVAAGFCPQSALAMDIQGMAKRRGRQDPLRRSYRFRTARG